MSSFSQVFWTADRDIFYWVAVPIAIAWTLMKCGFVALEEWRHHRMGRRAQVIHRPPRAVQTSCVGSIRRLPFDQDRSTNSASKGA